MALFIRKARRKDRIGLKECNERNLRENYSLDFWETNLLQSPGQSRVLIDPSGGRETVVGYVFSDGKTIISVAVDEKHRRQGWAQKMLKQVVDAAEGALTLHVRKSNEIAQRIYTGLGFSVVQEIPKYYKNAEEDALEMRRV